MDIRITRPAQGGTIRAIASKSEAHRLLICAALADGETFIACAERSQDIDATARCLEALGAAISYKQGGFHVTPLNRSAEEKDPAQRVLDCGESGATLRFLLPVCGALGLPVAFRMHGRLSQRPLHGLYDEMVSHGCALSEPGASTLASEGKLASGAYSLPGNISSQFVSGLLFALPLLAGDSTIHVTGTLESRPYADMTLDALRAFDATILEEEAQLFSIPGRQTLVSPRTAQAEGDWSNAAFWLSLGAIGRKPVTCTGLNINSRQGDKAITSLLSSLGANVTVSDTSANSMSFQGPRSGSPESHGGAVGRGEMGLYPPQEQSCDTLHYPTAATLDSGLPLRCIRNDVQHSPATSEVTVSPGSLKGIEIDAGDTPDLVPILAAVASVAEGRTVIRSAGRLRIKESDRLQTVAATLSSLGADITETEDGLIIRGQESLRGGEVRSFGDHRIAMTAAVISAACTGDVVIRDAEAVEKSYPAFFEDFNRKLGGECHAGDTRGVEY